MIEIVVASHNQDVLGRNLLQSNWIEEFPVHIQKYYTNISKAYNDIKTNGLVMYVHEDVYLPPTFEKDIYKAMEMLPDNWGVVGVAGVRMNPGKQIHGYILDRGRVWGRPIETPIEVDTLDELLLITKGDFVFDENLDLDFYGADICMQAKEQGRKNYVINGFCHHNSSRKVGARTESFYRCQDYFRNKWEKYLPIATTCTIVEKCLTQTS